MASSKPVGFKRTKHRNHHAPESRFDDLPSADSSSFVRIPFEELSNSDSQPKILQALQDQGFFVVSLPQDSVDSIINPLIDSMKKLFGEQVVLDKESMTFGKKYRMIYLDGVHSGYERIVFDNYENKRDPEERDIFQVHFRHVDQIQFPNQEFKDLSVVAYSLLHEVAIQALRSIAGSIGADFSAFSKTLTKSGSVDVEPKDNYTSNMSMFRYNDDTKMYTSDQKCMVHRDGGLITLLPRSTVPGIEIVNREQTHFIPIEKFTQPNDILIFPGLVMEYMTQGCIRSAIHRVVRKPGVERYSIPFELKPLKEVYIHQINTKTVLDAIPSYEAANTNIYDPVVFGAVCDNCDDVISQVRHKCASCEDYDLCDNCMKSGGVHDHHSFVKLLKDSPVYMGKQVPQGFLLEMLISQQRLRQRSYRLRENESHKKETIDIGKSENSAIPAFVAELNQAD